MGTTGTSTSVSKVEGQFRGGRPIFPDFFSFLLPQRFHRRIDVPGPGLLRSGGSQLQLSTSYDANGQVYIELGGLIAR